MSGYWLVSKSRRRRQLGALECHYLWDFYRTGFAIALAIHSFDPCSVAWSPMVGFCVEKGNKRDFQLRFDDERAYSEPLNVELPRT